MIYLKGTIIDNFQTERTAYRLIDFNLKDNTTTLENVLIFAKKYTRYVVDRKNGDYTTKFKKSENNQGFIDSDKQVFDRDINGKKGEFGNTLTEE
jgi:glucose dehydrogenase